jgi:hypothetical protein
MFAGLILKHSCNRNTRNKQTNTISFQKEKKQESCKKKREQWRATALEKKEEEG